MERHSDLPAPDGLLFYGERYGVKKNVPVAHWLELSQ